MAMNEMEDPDMIGAIKIKDGLFIGDEMAAQDLEFIVANKVTRVINCAGRQVPNHWEPIGVIYMTFFWGDEGMFDLKGEGMLSISNEIFEFIEETLEKLESVLVHSERGQSRASAVIAIYMMKKYKWTLLKTLEFLNFRRPDLEIRACYIQQLNMYENLMAKSYQNLYLGQVKTQDWNEISEKTYYLENEELLLTNTFLNARMGPLSEFNQNMPMHQYKHKRLVWADEKGLSLVIEESNNVDPQILKPSNYLNKQAPFGPKYTCEGKLDFYAQNGPTKNEMFKEDISDFESDILIQNTRVGIGQRAKFISSHNSKPNNNLNKEPSQVKSNQNIKSVYPQLMENKNPTDKSLKNLEAKGSLANNCDRIAGGNIINSSKINSTFMSPTEDKDSRNETFLKSCTDPSLIECKPVNSLNVQVPKSKPHSTVATKNKNMQSKVKRGISPSYPQSSKVKDQEDKKTFYPSNNQK